MADERIRLKLDVVAAPRPAAPEGFPAGGVILSEPMRRFRCNQKGCCCSGWDIPFRLEDFLRLHDHLDEADRAALTKKLKLVLEPPKDGGPIDVGEQVLHSLKLTGVGDDQHCRFLADSGGCGVHAKYGLPALPDLCVDFPSFGYRHQGDAVDLFFDPVCPEVLERLGESDEPLRLHRQEAPFGDPGFDLRAGHARTPLVAHADGVDLEPERFSALRVLLVEAFARPRPPWRSLAAVVEGLRELQHGQHLPPDWPPEPADVTHFLQFLHACIDCHSAELLAIMLARYRRFVFALDLAPVLAARDRLEKHLEEWRPAFEAHLDGQLDGLRGLVARWLAHRFGAPFTKQRGELRQAADAIVHLYGMALRYAAALGATLRRPVDPAIFKVAIGAAEFFYRSVHLPMQALPWYAGVRPEAASAG